MIISFVMSVSKKGEEPEPLPVVTLVLEKGRALTVHAAEEFHLHCGVHRPAENVHTLRDSQQRARGEGKLRARGDIYGTFDTHVS